MKTGSTSPAVLFVCLGNICRSPLAEAAFRRAVENAGLDIEVDSCGTAGYHVGEPPDPRTIDEAAKNGIDISHYRGRQLADEDFHRFTHILAMDKANLAEIERRKPDGARTHVALAMAAAGKPEREVADPYYGGPDGFAVTWADVNAAAKALVAVFVSERG